MGLQQYVPGGGPVVFQHVVGGAPVAIQQVALTPAKPEPKVPPSIFSLLHAAGLSDLNQYLSMISYVRIKADGGNPVHPWDDQKRQMATSMNWKVEDEAKDLWDYLEPHDTLRDICDKHRAVTEGTTVLSLKETCRDVIRSKLTGKVQNLFVTIPRLLLPKAMQHFLLYGEQLSE